jgi:hypothetical protein
MMSSTPMTMRATRSKAWMTSLTTGMRGAMSDADDEAEHALPRGAAHLAHQDEDPDDDERDGGDEDEDAAEEPDEDEDAQDDEDDSEDLVVGQRAGHGLANRSSVIGLALLSRPSQRGRQQSTPAWVS